LRQLRRISALITMYPPAISATAAAIWRSWVVSHTLNRLIASPARPGGSPFQADPRCPDRHQRAHLYQRRGLGIQQLRPGQVKPEPGLVLGEAFIDDRQPAQNLLEADRPVHTVTSLPETSTASQASAKVPTAQSSPAGVTAASHQGE
jgi:hypothetical protein